MLQDVIFHFVTFLPTYGFIECISSSMTTHDHSLGPIKQSNREFSIRNCALMFT